MARRAEGPFRIYASRGWAYIDATIAGERHRDALGVRFNDAGGRSPSRTAQEAAARRYADLVSERVVAAHDRVLTVGTLEELYAMWLDAISTPRNKKSIATLRGYGRTYVAWSKPLDADDERWQRDTRTPLERLVADQGPEDFMMWRFTRVLRKTVRKELSMLFKFLRWCKLRGYLASLPPRPTLPAGEPGVRSGKQRAKATKISAAEARAFIAELPSVSPGRRGKPESKFAVRAVFEFMWETGLRPITIARLEVGRNWARGSAELVLHDEDDKALYGRTLTLSKRAAAILEAWAPDEGPIFGEHDYRDHVRSAALKALPADKARAFARYDLRHGRARDLLRRSGGNLLGVAYQLGHKQITTTNAYLDPDRADGDAVITAASEDDGGSILSAAIVSDPSGRVDSNHRPPDPQRESGTESQRDHGGSGSSGDVKNPDEPPASDVDSAAFRQRDPLSRAAGALAIELAIWRSFDGWQFAAEEEDEP